ncbi:MAG: hypothetical protein ACI9QC_000312 [Oceanicoccus sp.]|jgi:hypothetical protein
MNRELKFPGQKPSERIQLLIRKHWIIDIKIALTFLMFGVLPFGAAVMGIIYFYEGAVTDNFLMGVLAFLVYFLITLVVVYVKWLNEELDVIIITNERVVSHDQVDLFHRKISETNINQIQDVIGIEKGFLGNMLHFGELKLQTAAHHILFEIHHASNPYQMAREVLDIREKYVDKESVDHHTAFTNL